MRFCMIIFMALTGAILLAGEPTDAEKAYKLGVDKLRDAQTDRTALVPATTLLLHAASLYEASGDDAMLTEVNSCLYWARKKFTLADVTAMSNNADAVKRLETAMKEIPVDQAQVMLDRADEYSKTHAEDPLLVAIRYFEVADRFKDTQAGRTAIDLSLKAMQRIGEKAKREAYKPAPTDGKVFVKSEPVGAEILLVTRDGGKLETGKVTPSIVQLPVGYQSLQLNLKSYKPAMMTVTVDGKTIAKPDAVKLEVLTMPVDVMFEEGWSVFVNGKPALVSGAGRAETPCTIELPAGAHQVTLAKEGFLDVVQKIEIKSLDEKVSVEPKQKAAIGKSTLLSAQAVKKGVRMPGTLYACGDDKADIYINGKFIVTSGFENGSATDLDLAVGDVIAVRMSNRSGRYGFSCVFKTKAGPFFLRTDKAIWFSYVPADSSQWWNVNPATTGGADTIEGDEISSRVVRQCQISCQQLWPSRLKEGAPGYLYHLVKETSFNK